MARMSDNEKCPSRDFGDSSQLTNWILDSGENYHIMSEVSDVIPGSFEDIELRIYPYPFCTSCQIYSMNKNDRSKIPLKPKTPFKWVYRYNSINSTQTFDR